MIKQSSRYIGTRHEHVLKNSWYYLSIVKRIPQAKTLYLISRRIGIYVPDCRDAEAHSQ